MKAFLLMQEYPYSWGISYHESYADALHYCNGGDGQLVAVHEVDCRDRDVNTTGGYLKAAYPTLGAIVESVPGLQLLREIAG